MEFYEMGSGWRMEKVTQKLPKDYKKENFKSAIGHRRWDKLSVRNILYVQVIYNYNLSNFPFHGPLMPSTDACGVHLGGPFIWWWRPWSFIQQSTSFHHLNECTISTTVQSI